MTIIITIFLFLLGLCIGSFLNVLVYRTMHEESPWTGRSHCDHCDQMVSWYDNVPLLSYIMLSGKSRCCRKNLSIQHPFLELLTGLLFVWWYLIGSAFFQLTQNPAKHVQSIYWLLIGLLLLIVLITDLAYMIIPDYSVVAIALLSLTYRVYLGAQGIMQWQDVGLALTSGVILMLAFYALWYITKRKGIGFGDVKFALAMGILLGWPKTLVGVFVALMVGSLVGVLLLLTKKKKLSNKIPFGPFLVIGTIYALILGEATWQWYLGMLFY